MKKLLSILIATTLLSSIPAPLLANTTLVRAKHDVGVSNSNNDYLPLKEIGGIPNKFFSFVVDNNENNFYLSVSFFELKQGSTTPESIIGIADKISNFSVVVDGNNSFFFNHKWCL